LAFHERFPGPDGIWTRRWSQLREALLEEAMSDPALQRAFEDATQLPDGYGAGMDERVIEWPWILAQGMNGRVLDAGSTLNHMHVLRKFAPKLDDLHIFTLEPEREAFWNTGISYVYGDLRELPYRDAWFDHICCISTLEHVGMDNAVYGSDSPRAGDADAAVDAAVSELMRALKPGGLLLITVPYGVPEDHGWQRVFDRDMVERLISSAGAHRAETKIYRYAREGWQVSDFDAAAGARYRQHELEPDPDDMAPNARALACVRLLKGAPPAAG
jgi:SAM-dependent methyltransferase